jgi:DNA-binding transcriptional ArsR family regulator
MANICGMDEVLRAIAEPRRLEILSLIRTVEMAAGEIAAHFAVTRPAISQHLRVLKDAGLVVERRQGTHRFYRASPEGLDGLRSALEWLWDDRLARLKALAEADEREGNGESKDSQG